MTTTPAASDTAPGSFSADTADPAEISRCFDQHGFVVINDVLTPERSSRLDALMCRHFRGLPPPPRTVYERFACDVISWAPELALIADLAAMAADRRFIALTAACIGDGHRDRDPLIMWSVLGGRGQTWHQDCPAGRVGDYNLNRLLYTRDVASDDGAVVVVPGSHRRGRIPRGEGQEDLPDQLELTPRAGALVLVHGWTFHRVTPNRSGRERLSINLRAYPRTCLGDPCSIGVYRNGSADFNNRTVSDD